MINNTNYYLVYRIINIAITLNKELLWQNVLFVNQKKANENVKLMGLSSAACVVVKNEMLQSVPVAHFSRMNL